jgi:hypothetical protein
MYIVLAKAHYYTTLPASRHRAIASVHIPTTSSNAFCCARNITVLQSLSVTAAFSVHQKLVIGFEWWLEIVWTKEVRIVVGRGWKPCIQDDMHTSPIPDTQIRRHTSYGRLEALSGAEAVTRHGLTWIAVAEPKCGYANCLHSPRTTKLTIVIREYSFVSTLYFGLFCCQNATSNFSTDSFLHYLGSFDLREVKRTT